MLEKITRFFCDVNCIATGNKGDKLFPADCCGIRNAPYRLSADSEQLWQALATFKPVAPGEGLLPKTFGLPVFCSPRAVAFESLARLLTLPVGNIHVQSLSTTALAAPDGSQGWLQSIDRAVNGFIHQLLPWQGAAAENTRQSEYRDMAFQLHRFHDDPALFSQQVAEFLRHIHLPLDETALRQLCADLPPMEIIFGYAAGSASHRQPRAHVDEMKRRVMMHELSLRDQRLASDSIGARIISWGERERQHSYALFMQGVESGSVEYLLKAGINAVLAELLQSTGEIFTGEIVARQPGESGGERALRLATYFVNPPEMAASKAFSFKPTLSVRPVQRLDGTLLTHPTSGITFQSVLQSDISGMRWQLFPQGKHNAIAVHHASSPLISREATLNTRTNKWHIDGMPGEYGFTHASAPEIFVKNSEGYYPVKASLDDGTLMMADGQKIYFHQQTRQWRPFYAANSHLHAGCMNVIADRAMTTAPARQGVLRTSFGSQRRVWQAQDGKYYLEIRAAAERPGSEINYYLEGWPEGDFFTVAGGENALFQQPVLQWRPASSRWQVADSPFNRLQQAEEVVNSRWLQQQAGPETLTPVENRPGLYHWQHQYLLRWRQTAEGEMSYLPLLPGDHPALYLPQQPGADNLRFRYDEQAAEWDLVPLSLRAFTGLPESVKVKPQNPFSTSYGLPGYQQVYRSGGESYIHIGHDKQGVAEYIQVEQHQEDSDLFSLFSSGDDGQQTHWLFRYNRHRDEFEIPLCQRIRRSDEQPCAGPSGISESERRWLNLHPQAEDESDIEYARRLYTTQGQRPGDAAIERHTGVSVDIFRTRMLLPKPQRLRDEEKQWLKNYPRQPGEVSVGYALRLLELREEQLADGVISSSTIDKNSIASYAKASKIDVIHHMRVEIIRWLNNHPRLMEEWNIPGETYAIWQEKNLAYAGRLLKSRSQPPKAMLVSLQDIATHVGLVTDLLQQKMQIERSGWLERLPRQPEETITGDEDLSGLQAKNQLYASRLTGLRDSQQLGWLISDKDIASHSRVTISTLHDMQQPAFSRSKLLASPPAPEIELLADNRLLHRQWEDWRLLLVDPEDLSHSLTDRLIKRPLKVEPMRKRPQGITKKQWSDIKQRFIEQANALIDSDGQSHEGFSIEFLEAVLDEQQHEIGVQIRAKQPVPAWTFLGGYSGVWHETEASLAREFKKKGSEKVLTYLWASKKHGAVSGLQNANKLALINTANIRGFSPLGSDNVAVGYINDLLPFYYTIKDIPAGEQLLIDYGDFYNPKYVIQTTINNDVIDIIARAEEKYFVVKSLGDNVATIYSPQGKITQLPKGVTAYTLQERMDDRYLIRYDIISKKGKKRIKITINNGDHLYYALAKAMDESGGKDIIKEKVAELKAQVAAAHPEQQGMIKPEPDDSE